MGSEIRNDSDITNVWKNQPIELTEISLGEIHRKAQRFQKRIFWRNLREYVASVIVIGIFGYYISVFHSTLVRTGCGLVIAGTLFVVCALHVRGATRTVPAELAFRTCVDFHRKELQRQRDLLRGVWSWYLLPFIPGLIIFLAGRLEQSMKQPNASAHAGVIAITFALTLMVCAVVFVGIGNLNQRAARKLEREIDTLDELKKEA